MDDKWRTIRCSNCGGQGMVCIYSYEDFDGAEDCLQCNGSGQIFIRPSGHLFLYPGGKAIGRDTKEAYLTADQYRSKDASEKVF